MRLTLWKAAVTSIVSLCGVAAIAADSAPVAVQPAAGQPQPAREEMTDDGPVLIAPNGMTLYTYGPDVTTPGKSQCSNVPRTTWQDTQGDFGRLPVVRPEAQKSCTQKWPPYMADASAKPVGDYGFIQRAEGGKQWAWRGRPLYFSVKDQKPGDRFGANFQSAGPRRGWGLAGPSIVVAAGLKVIRLDDSLALATIDNRPVYTPKNRHAATCRGCEDLFTPIVAPQLAETKGEWSVIKAGVGRRQYAYQDQPLYMPPEGITDQEIAEEGAWEPVLYRKGPGRPADIGTRPSLIGDVYTDAEGRTLYLFGCGTPTNDGVRCNDPGDPAGYWAALCGTAEECEKRWPLYRAGPNARPKGDWTIIEVAAPLYTDPRGFTYPEGVNRVKAWAYRGQPVYRFHRDTRPGDVRGHWVQWLGFSRFDALQVPGRGER